MRNYIIRRLILLIPILIGVTLLTFGLFRVIPGNACQIRTIGTTPEAQAACEHLVGLDKPGIPVSRQSDFPFVEFHPNNQYTNWLFDAAQLDFGHSIVEGNLPIGPQLEHRLPITIELGVLTLFFSLILGIPVGVLSAIRPGTLADWIGRFASIVWLSVPSFYLAILTITFGLKWFGWTPPQFGERTYVAIYEDPWVNLQEFVFPALVLAVGSAAFLMRLTRSAMLEVLRNDYIRTAWSKGLRERSVVWRHALKNALIPLATVLGLQIGSLLEGAVIIEAVFNLNGVGKYALESIIRRDITVVQSLTLLFALSAVLANLVVDVAYAWLDPRIHYA